MFFCRRVIRIITGAPFFRHPFNSVFFSGTPPEAISHLYGPVMPIKKSQDRSASAFAIALFAIVSLFCLLSAVFAVSANAQDQPVVVSNVKVEPNPFSPNNDGVNETAKFSFSLSEASAVTIEIVWFDTLVIVGGDTLHSGALNDTLLLGDTTYGFASDTIYLNNAAVSGLNEYVWDGKLGSLLLPDSTWTYMVRAEDLDSDDQFSTQPITGTFKIDSNPPVISSVGITPNPFSPDGNGINDEAIISFRLTGLPQNDKVGDIAFKLTYDIDNNPVDLVMDDPKSHPKFSSNDTLFFNDSLEINPPINSPIRLQFIPKSLNTNQISFLIQGGRVLDSGDTVAVSASVIIDAYNTNNPVDRNKTSTAKFSFITQVTNVAGSKNDNTTNLVEVRTFAGNVLVEVYNSSNVNVASGLALDPPFIGNGVYEATLSTVLPDDTYRFEITAVDESGNLAWVSRQVSAISEPIKITGLSVEPLIISPANLDNEADFTTISYTLNRIGNVTMQVFRDEGGQSANTLVRTILDGVAKQDEPHTETWGGIDSSGNYVSLGTEQNYIVVLSVYDPITTQTSVSSIALTVDNQKPEVLTISPLDRRTNQASLEVRGRADAGALVRLYRNGELAAVPELNAIGTFQSVVELGGDGLKQIFAHAFDEVGNGPTVSDTQQVLLDTRPPVAVDTVMRSGGSRPGLKGLVLTEFGPGDTLEIVLSEGGANVSGLELPTVNMRVFGPGSDEISGTLSLADPDTARFVPLATYSDSGTYSLFASFADSLGNRDSLVAVFSVGAAQPAPNLDSVSVNLSRGGYLNSRLDLTQQGSQWVFTAHIRDYSGTGLDSATSTVQLLNRAAQDIIEGSWTITGGNIVYTVGQNIATDGSMDGWYVMLLIVNDNDPATATLVTSDSLFNDTRRPDTLSVSADTARLGVTLRDLAPGSGISLLRSSLTVRPPTGVTLPEMSSTNDGDSTLFVEFDPPLSEPGIYSVDVSVIDRAGNQRLVTSQFTVGSVQVLPRITAVSQPFGGPVRTQSLTQPLSVWVLLDDIAGVGIDWDITGVSLLGPDSVALAGTVSNATDTLQLSLDGLLSNSGQDDGRYTLQVHAVNRAGGVLDSTLDFVLDNLPPDTSALVFVGDSSTIRISITDRPAVAGVDSSGALLLGAVATIIGPGDQQLATTTTHDGINTMIVTIEGGKPQTAGTYNLLVAIPDAAGNSRNVTIPFSLNVTSVLSVCPPDSSVVTGELAAIVLKAQGLPDGESAGAASALTVTRDGINVSGTLSLLGDSMVFVLGDTLRSDGVDDGLYRIAGVFDALSLGPVRQVNTLFTLDNKPPDTVGVRIDISSGGTLVTVELSDGGDYPQVAGIDRDATTAVVVDQGGRETAPLSKRWLDGSSVEFSLAPFSRGGLNRLRLSAVDRAGLVATFNITVVNNEGAGQGASTAFVEEVPARTSANISFVSGRAGATITRAVLRIFNLRGDLVRRIDVSGRIGSNGSQVSAQWLLANDGGEYVNNGVFIYYWEVTFSDGRIERIRKTLAVARR